MTVDCFKITQAFLSAVHDRDSLEAHILVERFADGYDLFLECIRQLESTLRYINHLNLNTLTLCQRLYHTSILTQCQYAVLKIFILYAFTCIELFKN